MADEMANKAIDLIQNRQNTRRFETVKIKQMSGLIWKNILKKSIAWGKMRERRNRLLEEIEYLERI